MTNIPRLSKRQFIKIGGSAALVLATPQIMTRSALASADMMGPSSANFFRFKLGEFEITTLLDGSRAGDGPHPIFGMDQPAEKMHALLRENHLPETKVVGYFAPTIVNTGKELVLFDTGLGEGARKGGLGQMRKVLGQAGYTPEQVDVVVISHMHPDHIGGLMEGGEASFPNARYVTGRVEYDFWAAPERMGGATEKLAKMVAAKVTPFAEKMRFIENGESVVSGISAMAAYGHTPGHMIFNLESAGRRLVIAVDTANHYVASLQRPDWEVRYDANKKAAAKTRKAVFDMIANDRIPFIGYHMPFPSVGFVEQMDIGYRYIPNSYQLDL